MSRSRGFVAALMRIERATKRAQAAEARAVVRARRQAENERRANERSRLVQAKEGKRIYVESRLAEVEDQNAELRQTVATLESILSDVLTKDSSLDLDTLKEPLTNEPFQPGELARHHPAPELDDYLPPSPVWLMRLVPGTKAKHKRLSAEAQERFDLAVAAHAEGERQRRQKLEEARTGHEAKIAENKRRVEAQHDEVEELKRGFRARTAEAVAAYFTLVLSRSEYPEGFPTCIEVTYEPEPKLVAVDMELPLFDIVPEVGSFKYVKGKDEITESPRSAKDRRSLYSSVIAQTALRAIREVFSADKASQAVDTVAFSGYVNGIDRGTGQPAKPCLVSVLASPDIFAGFDLRRVDPAACLRELHAAFSKHPEELTPVERTFEFNVAKSPVRKIVKP
jgi:restriction system protein